MVRPTVHRIYSAFISVNDCYIKSLLTGRPALLKSTCAEWVWHVVCRILTLTIYAISDKSSQSLDLGLKLTKMHGLHHYCLGHRGPNVTYSFFSSLSLNERSPITAGVAWIEVVFLSSVNDATLHGKNHLMIVYD